MKKNFQLLLAVFLWVISTNLLNAQWTSVYTSSNGLSTIAGKENDLYLGTGTGIYKSTDNGITWSAPGESGNFVARTIVITSANIFAGCYGAGIYSSTDDGKSWNSCSNGLGGTIVTAIVVVDTNIYANNYLDGGPHGLFTCGLYKSTNNGNAWYSPNEYMHYMSINAFANKDTNLFAGGDNGVYLSTDKGVSWTILYHGLTFKDVNTMTVSDSCLFVGTWSGGVFRSTNNGANWTAVNNGLTYLRISRLVSYGSNILASTYGGGVFLSTNNGSSWRALNDGLSDLYVVDLKIINNNLYCVNNYTLLSRPLFGLVSVEENSDNIPINYKLNQNYPNPFNPSTTISFSIPAKEFVTLKIYDALGKEIATLVNEEIQPGTYQKEWSAGDLSSGVYFYRLQAGNYCETKKLLLLK